MKREARGERRAAATPAERPLAVVPRWVVALLVAAFCAQVAWQASQPQPSAAAEALGVPASPRVLRAAAGGETIVLAQVLTLYVQAFDNQPGISLPFLRLDYARVIAWLQAILELDSQGQYPLLLAAQVYSQVPDPAKQRAMCDFVRSQFSRDPDRRWRWLAHCAIVAKHRLRDTRLALAYAEAIAREARFASGWARQMPVFLLEDLGETDAATILLGGLLASGEVSDPKEIDFLTQKLEQLKAGEKSSPPSGIRRPPP